MAPGNRAYRHIVERAFQALRAAGTPQPAEKLAAAGLGSPVVRQPQLIAMLSAGLEGDERFIRHTAGTWALRSWGDETRLLAEQTFAVVDVETNGGQRERHRVIETAAVVLKAGSIVRRYASLVNPQQPLPRFITALNGITDELLAGARTADRVLPELAEVAGDAVIAGHNVACDIGFLNYEALWHELPPFTNRTIDTQALAERLLPEVTRPSLSRVAAAIGLGIPSRHRALADAELTAGVLLHLLQALDRVGVRTWANLEQWLAAPGGAVPAAARQPRRHFTLPDLPEEPGVYRFVDAAGATLYVGKAASLRQRVPQHFGGASRLVRLDDGLLARTASVEYEVVPTDLDALLIEAERIEAQRPPYNVQARRRRGLPFLRFDGEPYPRAIVSADPGPPGSFLAGPYRTTQQARQMVRIVRRVFQIRACRRRLPARRKAMRLPCLLLGQELCQAPCAGAIEPPVYANLVEAAQLFIAAGKLKTLEALDARIAALKAQPAGEPGLEPLLRTARDRLTRVRREHRPLGGGAGGGRLAMAYPTIDGARVFLVEHGRLLVRTTLPAGELMPAAASALATAERALRAESPAAARHDGASDIILRWIHHHAGEPELLPIVDGWTAPVTLQAVAALAALCARGSRPPGSAAAEPLQQPVIEAHVVHRGQALGRRVFDLEEMPQVGP